MLITHELSKMSFEYSTKKYSSTFTIPTIISKNNFFSKLAPTMLEVLETLLLLPHLHGHLLILGLHGQVFEIFITHKSCFATFNVTCFKLFKIHS